MIHPLIFHEGLQLLETDTIHDSPSVLLPPVEARLVDFDVNRGCLYGCPHSSCRHSTSHEQRDAPFLWTSRCHTCCPSVARPTYLESIRSVEQPGLIVHRFIPIKVPLDVCEHTFRRFDRNPDQKPCLT